MKKLYRNWNWNDYNYCIETDTQMIDVELYTNSNWNDIKYWNITGSNLFPHQSHSMDIRLSSLFLVYQVEIFDFPVDSLFWYEYFIHSYNMIKPSHSS